MAAEIQKEMRMNYILTLVKTGKVTHSCVGNFTSPLEKNLLVAKCTRIEIYLILPQGLQLIKDHSIHGKIVSFEIFRPPGETRDALFVAIEKGQSRVLQWDHGEIVNRTSENEEMFKVIPFEYNKKLKEVFFMTGPDVHYIVDIKFLFGCLNPTIVVLYKDKKDDHYLKTFEICFDKIEMKKVGPWFNEQNISKAKSLMPVPPPFCGVLVMGYGTVTYISAFTVKRITISPTSKTRICRKFDAEGLQYLFGDDKGLLHHLTILTNERKRVTGLRIDLLGETSIASSISYLGNETVFIGSSSGESQLIKLKVQPDAKGSFVEVLERYVNLAPITDFCVVDLERQGQSQIVACSCNSEEGCVGILKNGITINELASVELQGITNMWSLRSDITSPYHTFLVVSFINHISIFSMKSMGVLKETLIDGFCSDQQTLFCHDAAHDQLVQVTSNTVRLVSSATKELLNEWSAPEGFLINVATANVSQVLLATGNRHLIYLAIGNGVLTEVKRTQLAYEISCMDIIPIGDNQDCSQLAVGTWTCMVAIFSLPEMNLITEEHLGGEIIPRSILFCSFEGISYLLCGLGDGHLLNFVLNTSNGELADRKKVFLGTQPITLSRDTAHVFAASDRTTIICSRNKKLIYINVNLKQVRHMCPFNTDSFPYSFAIAKGEELMFGTGIQKFHIRSVPLKARAICHQDQTKTFAICTTELNSVQLLDDQTFEIISTHPLNRFESMCSLISCSFSDGHVYYCVGTESVLNETKGRILIFSVREKKLELVGEKLFSCVGCILQSFRGKLLAAGAKMGLYTCVLKADGSVDIQKECSIELKKHSRVRHLKSFGDYIVVSCLKESFTIFRYHPTKDEFQELHHSRRGKNMIAVELIDENTCIEADDNFNLNSVQTSVDRGSKVVSRFHLGDLVSRFKKGSKLIPDLGVVPTVIFGTVNGVIGIISSLPQDQYSFLNKLQSSMREVIKGVGGFSHQEWRSCYSCRIKRTVDAESFLDGDFIASFLDLSKSQMEEISTKMTTPVDELKERVQVLTRLEFI